MFSDMGSQLLGGGSGPLASLFGDKHSSTGLSFPSDVEGVGQRHFIRFSIVDIDGGKIETAGEKSSTEAETSAEGTLLGGLAGAAVGGGIGGALLGGVVGNAADKLGVSSAVGSLVSGAEDIIGNVGGALDSAVGGIAGSLETGIESVVETALGPVVGAVDDLVGGALDVVQDLTAGALDVAGDLLSGEIPDIPDLPSLDDIGAKLNLDALKDLIPDLDKIELPTPDFSMLENAWDDISGAVSDTWGEISALPGKLADAIRDEEPPEADAAMPAAEGESEETSPVTEGTRSTVGDIILYIPFGISETYQANWSGGNLGIYGAIDTKGIDTALSKLGSAVLNKNSEAIRDAVSSGYDALQAAADNAGANKSGFTAEFLGRGLGAALQNDAIVKHKLKLESGGGGERGLSVNPHFDLFFDGVNNRTFTFDFKMAPKNATEAANIASIVRMFKTHAAPGENAGMTRYWTYPHVFQIEYWNLENTHRIKDCALVNINVNYSGIGDNHTFYDGYPIQTDISLTFAEMSLLTREDFEQGF